MRFLVVAVGKPRDAALAAAIREYEVRASRYWPTEFLEVRAATGRTDPAGVMAKEAESIGDAIPTGCDLWICDARGRVFTSEQFADWMQRTREAARDVAIVIGGAHGVDARLRAAAVGTLSLGTLTFAHELARLVLAEQLYRAGTIVRGEPYHK